MFIYLTNYISLYDSRKYYGSRAINPTTMFGSTGTHFYYNTQQDAFRQYNGFSWVTVDNPTRTRFIGKRNYNQLARWLRGKSFFNTSNFSEFITFIDVDNVLKMIIAYSDEMIDFPTHTINFNRIPTSTQGNNHPDYDEYVRLLGTENTGTNDFLHPIDFSPSSFLSVDEENKLLTLTFWIKNNGPGDISGSIRVCGVFTDEHDDIVTQTGEIVDLPLNEIINPNRMIDMLNGSREPIEFLGMVVSDVPEVEYGWYGELEISEGFSTTGALHPMILPFPQQAAHLYVAGFDFRPLSWTKEGAWPDWEWYLTGGLELTQPLGVSIPETPETPIKITNEDDKEVVTTVEIIIPSCPTPMRIVPFVIMPEEPVELYEVFP